jgi:hypothetical protein
MGFDLPPQPAHTEPRVIGRMRLAIRHPYFPILILVLFNLVVGALVVADYGESWDEQLRYRYADKSLAAYMGDLRTLRDEKGPFYVMLARLGSEALGRIIPGWLSIDSWHFMHFLSFQLAILFLYDLAIQRLQKAAAFGAALLFSTQPLLWGHAFINPKDIPFMAFFLGSVALGMRLFRQLKAGTGKPTLNESSALSPGSVYPKLVQQDWRDRSGIRKVGWVFLILAAAALLAAVLWRGMIQEGLSRLVLNAYTAGEDQLLGRLFAMLATNASQIPVEQYIQKAQALLPLALAALALLWLGGLLLLLAFRFPQSWAYTRREVLAPGGRAYLAAFKFPVLLAAGFLLGVTTSIRVLGPFAGLLVAVYFWLHLRWRALPALLAYATTALVVTYATWPALWNAPLRAFRASFLMASDFDWHGKVLFQGTQYLSTDLPARFLPTLLTIQLSEVALFLFAAGMLVLGYATWKKNGDWPWALLLASWFFLPVFGFMLVRPNIYDNFRHFLFILPPVFLFAGYALQAGLRLIRRSWLKVAIIGLLVLPQVMSLIQLHPYEYTYYNLLVGGVRGAFREYELDYWATSYRAATEYLNQTAPPNAAVIVWGPDHIVARFARPDLQIVPYQEADSVPRENTYILLSSRSSKDEIDYPDAPVVAEIGRAGAVYAVVKWLGSGLP